MATAANAPVLLTDFSPGSNGGAAQGVHRYRAKPTTGAVAADTPLPAALGRKDWGTAVLSADGNVVAGSRYGEFATSYVIRDGVAASLPLRQVLHLSGDARFVFGLDQAGNLMRLDLRDDSALLLVGKAQNPASVAAVSHDGAAAVIEQRAWTVSGGVRADLPAGFVPWSVSGDGLTFVGSQDNHPAYWTQAGGLVVWREGDPEVRGGLYSVSFDGSVMGGSSSSRDGRVQIWTRDGQAYRIAELLPNGTQAALRYRENLSVERISYDGRTLFGRATSNVIPDAQAAAEYDYGWVATVVLPGDRPRATLASGPAGRWQFKVPSVAGFRFQFQRAAPLDQWEPIGAAADGTGGELSFEADAGGPAAFFRVLAEPASP